MLNEDELIAFLFEIASVGILNRKFSNAPGIFNTLMESLPHLEAPLVGAATFSLLNGRYEKAVELLQSRRKFIKEPSVAFEASLAHALSLNGQVAEAERLLLKAIEGKPDSAQGVAFAKSILEEIRSGVNTPGSSQIAGRLF